MSDDPMITSSEPAETPSSPLDAVGQKLRHARLAAGISLREMSRRVDVSPSFISQVERGRTKPSVGTLYAIATELGVLLDDLMPRPTGESARIRVADAPEPAPPDDERISMIQRGLARPFEADALNVDPGSPVQRGDRRHELRMDRATWGRLTADHDPANDFLHVVYSPGGASCPANALIHHPGIEYGYVISGRLKVQVGFDSYELAAGDSIRFDSKTPHRLHNPFDVDSESIWMVVGRGGTPVL